MRLVMIPGKFGTCGFHEKRGGGKEKRALRTTDSAECDCKERDAGELVVPRCNSHSAGGRRAPTMSTSTRCLRSGGRTDTARCEFAPFPSAKKNKFNQGLALAVSYQVIIPLTWAAFPLCYDLRNHCLKCTRLLPNNVSREAALTFFFFLTHTTILEFYRGEDSHSAQIQWKPTVVQHRIDGIVLPSPAWRTLQSKNTTTWCSYHLFTTNQTDESPVHCIIFFFDVFFVTGHLLNTKWVSIVLTLPGNLPLH